MSDTPSALTREVKRYSLGQVVPADDLTALKTGIISLAGREQKETVWDDYMKAASWESHVEIAIQTFNKSVKN